MVHGLSALARLRVVAVALGVLLVQGRAPCQIETRAQLASEVSSRLDDPARGEAAMSEAATSVLVGQVLGPDGAPVAGAVVVTSAGGQAETDAQGRFSLEVSLPVEAESVHVTAVMGSGTASLTASVQVGGLVPWGTTSAGTLVLEQAAACQPSWLPTFGQAPGVSGFTISSVQDLAVFDDGSGPALYVGGAIVYAGGLEVNSIAKWDGTTWSALGSGMYDDFGGATAYVAALAVFDDGSGPALYAGGSFLTAGGVSANSIAKWNGTAWSALGSGMNGLGVSCLTTFDDGSGPALYAGGSFTTAGGVTANRVAKWDGTSWSPLGSGMGAETGSPSPYVSALTVFDDGSGPALYAGGYFTTAGGMPANSIAKWSGTSWSALGSGIGGDFGGGVVAQVSALTGFDDGSGPALCAGGYFLTAGGVSAKHIAKWDGTAWSAMGSGMNQGVGELEVFDDGSGPALYAGGGFTSAGGTAAHDIAKWNGTSWSALGGGLLAGGEPYGPSVNALTAFDDGSGPALFVGGSFTTAAAVAVNRIARWDVSTWSVLGNGLDGPVYGLTVFDDGHGPALYASGSFTIAAGKPKNHIAKWNGSSWSKLGTGLDSSAGAFAVFDDGSGAALYAGGSFTTAGAVPASCIAKWSGTSWSALGSGMGGSNPGVYALAVFDDGSGPALYAGGSFSTAGGVSAKSIAKWDGSNWSALGSGMMFSASLGWVNALTVFDDGSGPALYAGGTFNTAGGVPANSIAKWDGTSWSALGSGLSGTVRALTIFDDGSGPALYAGGGFGSAGGVAASSIAKWDGTTWSALGSGIGGFPTDVFDLTVFDDGSGPALFACGSFTLAGGGAANRIAKWDGSSWSALGSGMNSYVFEVTVFDDGSGPALYAGGLFSSALDSGDAFLAKWGGCPASPPTWTDLGSGLAGVSGIPHLTGVGTLEVGSPGSLGLMEAAPSSAAMLFGALASTPTPFKGGTLVPVPVLLSLVIATDPLGEMLIPWAAWPPGLSGLSLFFQYAISDSAAVKGVALSNALSADVP